MRSYATDIAMEGKSSHLASARDVIAGRSVIHIPLDALLLHLTPVASWNQKLIHLSSLPISFAPSVAIKPIVGSSKENSITT